MLPHMAELMHEDVVLKLFGEIDNAVVKGEIAFCRATAPPGLLISYGNGPVRVSVLLIELFESYVHKHTGCFQCLQILS